MAQERVRKQQRQSAAKTETTVDELPHAPHDAEAIKAETDALLDDIDELLAEHKRTV